MKTNSILIFFSQEHADFLDQYKNHFSIQQCSDFPEWEKNKIIPSAFIVNGNDQRYVSSILGKIRRDNEVFASLCFVTKSVPSSDHCLSDGLLPEPLILQKQIDKAQDLLTSLKGKETYLTHQGRLIKYLWLRPDFILQPDHEWQYARFYRYPLLEALSLDQSDSFEWLRGILPKPK